MNLKSILLKFIVASSLTVAAPMFAQHHASDHAEKKESKQAAGHLVKVTDKDAAWADQARKNYPLKVCLVSGEDLGSMGRSPEYIYRVDGQPDHLVIFCCDGCEEDYMKEPAQYLAKLKAARGSQKAPDDGKPSGHMGHH